MRISPSTATGGPPGIRLGLVNGGCRKPPADPTKKKNLVRSVLRVGLKEVFAPTAPDLGFQRVIVYILL